MEEFLDATVKNIELGRHRRARIWLGSLPDAAYRSPGKLTRSWVASLAPPVPNRSAAIELLVPKGGRFAYGLLGGVFEEIPQPQFVLDVQEGTTDDHAYTSSLAEPLDLIRVGLPTEYCKAIVDGFESSRQKLGYLY